MYLDTFATGMKDDQFVVCIWFLLFSVGLCAIILHMILSNLAKFAKWIFAIGYALMEKK